MNGNIEDRIFKQLDDIKWCMEKNRKEIKEDLKDYVDKNDTAHDHLGDKIDQWPTTLAKEKNHCVDTFASKIQTKWLFLMMIGLGSGVVSIAVYAAQHSH